MVHVRKKGKLVSRYIRPFGVLKKVKAVSYKLDLPASMDRIHPFSHVPSSWKCVSNPSKVLSEPRAEVLGDLTYVEQLVWIMDT